MLLSQETCTYPHLLLLTSNSESLGTTQVEETIHAMNEEQFVVLEIKSYYHHHHCHGSDPDLSNSAQWPKKESRSVPKNYIPVVCL